MKTKSFYICFIVALIFFLMACASTNYLIEKELRDSKTPKYDGPITPIVIPIQAEYTPVKIEFKVSTSMSMSDMINGSIVNDTSHLETVGKKEVLKLGELLTWDISINKLITNRDTLAPNTAIVSLRVLTDKYGNIHESEIMSSFLDGSSVNKKVRDNLIEGIRKSMKVFGVAPILTNVPLRSGDTIMEIDKALFAEMMETTEENVSFTKELKWKVDGWSYFNKRRVIVTSIDDDAAIYYKDYRLDIEVKGYCIFDPESFQIIDGKTLFLMNAPLRNNDYFSTKAFSHHSSRLIE